MKLSVSIADELWAEAQELSAADSSVSGIVQRAVAAYVQARKAPAQARASQTGQLLFPFTELLYADSVREQLHEELETAREHVLRADRARFERGYRFALQLASVDGWSFAVLDELTKLPADEREGRVGSLLVSKQHTPRYLSLLEQSWFTLEEADTFPRVRADEPMCWTGFWAGVADLRVSLLPSAELVHGSEELPQKYEAQEREQARQALAHLVRERYGEGYQFAMQAGIYLDATDTDAILDRNWNPNDFTTIQERLAALGPRYETGQPFWTGFRDGLQDMRRTLAALPGEQVVSLDPDDMPFE